DAANASTALTTGPMREDAMAGSESTANRPTFASLLESAVREPGTMHQAYRAFHGFSLGNQLLAALQCAERGITLGPLATYDGWKAKGRYVRKGQRAISLWRPITVKQEPAQEGDEPTLVTRFVLRPFWFTLAQTDGKDVELVPVAEWDKARALSALQ